MITVSQAVRDLIEEGRVPEFQAVVTYADNTSETVTADRFLSGSPVIRKGMSAAGVFTIGGAVIGSFGFSLMNDDGHFDAADFAGAQVVPQVSYDSETWYSLGTFFFASHKSAGGVIICTAYDALALMDEAEFSSWPCTFLQAAQAVCTAHGLTLAATSFDGASMSFADPGVTMTERMTLSYMAQCTGNHVRINAAGELVIEKVTGDTKAVSSVFEANLQTAVINYTGVRITPYGSDSPSLYGIEGNVLSIDGNPLISVLNVETVGETLQTFLSEVTAAEYTAGDVDILSDFTLEPGDVLTLDDMREVSHSFLITNLTYKLGVRESISCDAEDPASNDLRPEHTEMQSLAFTNTLKDEISEHFWHDTNGAHVLGDASGYRNDIDSTGMHIVDITAEKDVAVFGANGVQLGKTDESHVVIDFHSLRLISKEGDHYFFVSDLRDEDGYARRLDTFYGDGESSVFRLTCPATDANYDAYVYDASGITISNKTTYQVELSAALPNGATLEVRYMTAVPVMAFTFGERQSGEVLGPNSVVFGKTNVASNENSVAIGKYSKASGAGALAEGYDCIASGGWSHAEGDTTHASGSAAHAEGSGSTASGGWSHAEGISSLADGMAAHAQNYFTIARSNYQTAIGKYNVEDNSNSYVLIIGNGASASSRSNALTIDWNGSSILGNSSVTGAVYTRLVTSARSVELFNYQTSGNVGLYDRGNTEWILRSDSNRVVYIPHNFRIGDSSLTGVNMQLISGTRNGGVNLSSADNFGLYDNTNSSWVIRSSGGQASGETLGDVFIPHPLNVGGRLSAPNIVSGTVTITPTAADTPTGKAVTWPNMGGTPYVVATARTTAPGTVVKAVSFYDASATGCTIYVTRSNTTNTPVNYIAIY